MKRLRDHPAVVFISVVTSIIVIIWGIIQIYEYGHGKGWWGQDVASQTPLVEEPISPPTETSRPTEIPIRLTETPPPLQPQLKSELMGHMSAVNSVAFSRDGQTLASGSADNTIRLWDVASG